MQPLSSSQIMELHQLLLTQKDHLTKHLSLKDQFGMTLSPRESAGELSTYDNHPADIGTELFEQSKEIALNLNAEMHLREVNEALAKIAANGYNGLCIHCGQSIPYERLLVIPETQYCIAHVPSIVITTEYRPIEEQLLPLSEHKSLDERIRNNQFSGEDAWNMVESWGTSDSPAMSIDNEVQDYNDMSLEEDENAGYVEAFESFVATDIYGKEVSVVRNKAFRKYMANHEGDPLLEPDL